MKKTDITLSKTVFLAQRPCNYGRMWLRRHFDGSLPAAIRFLLNCPESKWRRNSDYFERVGIGYEVFFHLAWLLKTARTMGLIDADERNPYLIAAYATDAECWAAKPLLLKILPHVPEEGW